MSEAPLTVAVFASGGGTNFQALLDHQSSQDGWRIGLLVVNHEAGAQEKARQAEVPVRIIATKDRLPGSVSVETLATLEEFGVDLILLSGYLRRLPTEVVQQFAGRILNVHPALLPDFGGKGMYGMNVHQAVVDSDAAVSGATVHFVSEQYDEGENLGQWRVEVRPGDTALELAARVLRVEHQLYPKAVDHLVEALRENRSPKPMPDLWLNGSRSSERSLLPTDSNEEEV